MNTRRVGGTPQNQNRYQSNSRGSNMYNNGRSQYQNLNQIYDLKSKVNDSNSKKLLAARDAREKLDLYRSFETDEDNEFYPHHQDSSKNLKNFSQSQQGYNSPLSTPDRSNFQSNLTSLYSSSQNSTQYISPSPQGNYINNQSMALLLSNRNYRSQNYYSAQNAIRTRY